MGIKKRAAEIFNGNSGASMLFVLGVMLLLLGMGASAFIAASTNTGYWVAQREYSRMLILSESIHRNIRHSLEENPADESLLSYQLVWAVYRSHDDDFDEYKDVATFTSLKLEAEVRDMANDLYDNFDGDISIELIFSEQYINISKAIKAIPPTYEPELDIDGEPVLDADDNPVYIEIDPGAPREPKKATVDFTMAVTVSLETKGKTTTSRAVYAYKGGRLSDEEAFEGENGDEFEDQFDPYDPPDSFDPIDEEYKMKFLDFGGWELIRYEKINTV
ncbi:MAG: hypothetical protein FWH06_04550 [Oscillospiraceae bacterium]|nr:hypothetical protein [Oscillospiraceae bacterium]